MLSFGALRIEGPATTEGTTKYATILCPECGAKTQARSDGSVLCASCVLATQDWRSVLEEHITRYPKVLSFTRCPSCLRVQTDHPKRWVEGTSHESEALLALLLRRVKDALLGKRALQSIDGMGRALREGSLGVEDARFVWTEPHSRRVQLEVLVAHTPDQNGGMVPKTQHKCQLTFQEDRARCDDCQSERPGKMGSSSGGDFGAKIQIRAKRPHGGTGGDRTLRALEESLSKTSASSTATAARRVARSHNGFDVEFHSRQDAAKFLHELRRLGRAPLKFADETKKLVTHDANSSTSEWQRTTLISVPPVDKHDVVLVEREDDSSQQRFHLVLHVRATIRLLDLVSKRERDVSAEQYFKKPFETVLDVGSLVADFRVLDSEVAAKIVVVGDKEEEEASTIRRYVAPFACKPGALYKGYDLDVIAHRVSLPPALPRVVLVVPGGQPTAPKKKKQHQQPHDHEEERPKVEPPRVLSRKERRQNRKKQDKERRGAPLSPPEEDAPSAPAAPAESQEEDEDHDHFSGRGHGAGAFLLDDDV
mmetsp:Transcript_12433/g.40674  ORF Transcript_12433/g.40674 Transcript_12433/m.40674 type:complete len:537 (-) Transcript_12433:1057-2667(-)